MLFTLALTAGSSWSGRRARSEASVPPDLGAARIPGRGDRVLVFAAHPDDETLGVGGLIYEARRRGADVRVVFFTSGDGFPLCALRQYGVWPEPSVMRRLAADRREESRAALAALGVPAAAITFLGYPDRGLAAVWLDHWSPDRPFTSPYTGARASGESVLADVEALLRQAHPTHVYYPDPADDHPDHWAAHCFVRMALERVFEDEPPLHRTYLVHRGQWPLPLATNRDLYLAPPAPLRGLGAVWETVPLTCEAISAKEAALGAYRSQQSVAGSFLSAFVRRNELVADWAGERGEGRGESAGGSLPDAVRDRWGRARSGAVDFTQLGLSADGGELRVRAVLREPAAAWPEYRLYWKPVLGSPETLCTRAYRILSYRCEPTGSRFSIRGNALEVRVPREEIAGAGAVMVAAEAWAGPLLLDRTPWRLVRLR